MESQILQLEKEFDEAMIQNDAEAIGRFLADEWFIIDPDGSMIDKSRFLSVIRSGALSHKAMDSEDIRVRVYEDSATVTAVTTSRTIYRGQEFTTKERATDVFVRRDGKWAMCPDTLDILREEVKGNQSSKRAEQLSAGILSG